MLISFMPVKVPVSPFTPQVPVLPGVLGLKGGQQTDGAHPTVLDEGVRDDLWGLVNGPIWPFLHTGYGLGCFCQGVGYSHLTAPNPDTS